MTKDKLIQQAFKESEALKLTLHKLQAEIGGTDLQRRSVQCFIYLNTFNEALLRERPADAKPKLRLL